MVRDPLPGRLAYLGIEPQIQRPFRIEPEPAGLIRQLVGRETQIEQNAVHFRQLVFREDSGNLNVTGEVQMAVGFGQPGFRQAEHHGVAVQADEQSGFADAVADLSAVAPGPDGSIHHDLPGLKIKNLKDFPEQDGLMNRARTSGISC